MVALLAGVVIPSLAGAQGSRGRALTELSLEELGQVEITSVSRRAERLADAAASIFVITNDDIRRSGASTLPEALRLAPNLQVARIDASQYAISARGFNNSIGNKLLVMVDGRTVYTPLFSGVFWDMQDVMLEDVERIEVISGPGATLWGANAVNGVINVITRSAGDTQGRLLALAAGNQEKGAAFRHGGVLANGGHYRVYGKASAVDNTQLPNGIAVRDSRELQQAGFRADWGAGIDRFTFQGDAYGGRSEDRGVVGPFVLGRIGVSGANMLGRWSRAFADGSDLRLQAYYDHAERSDAVLFRTKSDIVDLDFQHGIPFARHRVTWGGGYRYGEDHVPDAILAGLRPSQKALSWANVFVHDEFRLTDTVVLSGGWKVEHNDYTGFEHLPSARLAWKASPSRLVWAAVSRAVRSPSRFDREITTPIAPGATIGGPSFTSEIARVYELGYRAQPGRAASYSVTLFRHDWDRLRSGTGTAPLELQNAIRGHVYGVEAWATWQPASFWRLRGGFVRLNKNLQRTSESTDPLGPDNITLGNDPKLQWQLRTSFDVGARQELDIGVRHVGRLPVTATPVEPYTALDVRYAWRYDKQLELSATATNLLDPSHPEFRTSALAPNEIQRAIVLKALWSF